MIKPYIKPTSIRRGSLSTQTCSLISFEKRFPSKCKSKLMPRSDGPFEVIEKIGPNTYKVDLSSEY